MNSPTERVVFVVLLVFIAIVAMAERKNIKGWWERRKYGFLG
ncbi:hypothetical protein AALC17_12590 [Oscillospiraceae bacterium 38-13]